MPETKEARKKKRSLSFYPLASEMAIAISVACGLKMNELMVDESDNAFLIEEELQPMSLDKAEAYYNQPSMPALCAAEGKTTPYGSELSLTKGV